MSRRCYLCDAPIQNTGYRRWVTTGGLGYGRVYVSRRGVSGSSTGGTRKGLRTVCARCAVEIDLTIARDRRIARTVIECVVIIVAGIFVLHYIELGYPDHPEPAAIHQKALTNG